MSAAHKITSLTVVYGDRVEWACECGCGGICPREVAIERLTEHMGGQA